MHNIQALLYKDFPRELGWVEFSRIGLEGKTTKEAPIDLGEQ